MAFLAAGSLLCSVATAQVEIVDQSISVSSARDGQTVSLRYQIQNNQQRDAWLGATMIGPDGNRFDDPTNEDLVDDRVNLRSGTHWYERDFFINLPPSAASGDYHVEWEVHWGTSGFTSVRRDNAVDIRPPLPVDVPVLMYHKVGNTAHTRFWVRARELENQIRALLEEGYTPVTLDDVAGFRAGTQTAPNKPIVITFDDGYEDLVTHVLPIISKNDLRVPVTAFVNPDLVGDTNTWDPGIDFNEEPEVNHATWNQIRQLHDSGLVDIQSHTLSHANLLTTSSSQERFRELEEARLEIESRLNKPVRFLAYPWGAGAHEAEVHRDVHRAGYFMALGIENAPETRTRNKFALRRIDIHWNVRSAYSQEDLHNFLFGPNLLKDTSIGEDYFVHPADSQGDWRIRDNDLTQYLSSWLEGSSTPDSYVTRAIELWMRGGKYGLDSNESAAAMWKSNP